MSNVLIISPQVVTDKENRKIHFFRFDLKAVQSIVNDARVDYKLHHHAFTSIEMTFDSDASFNTACMALLMHYQPLNEG